MDRTRPESAPFVSRAVSVALVVAVCVLAWLVAPPPSSAAEEPAPVPSVLTTWTCTGTPCPWGAQTTGHAATWPSALSPIRTRHGYTTSADVYVPGATASGHKVTVHTGTASVYAGTPSAGSHRLITTIATGATVTLPAIGADEVFSVQSDNAFTSTLVAGTPPAPEPQPTGNRASVFTTWSCTGTPCPWGAQTTGHAAAWPSTLNPIRTRHGYTTSADVYAPGTTTSGHQVTVTTGTASIYAGTPTGSHRLIRTVATGATATLPALGADEVFSIQSDNPFTYTLVAGTPPDPEPQPTGNRSSVFTTWSCTGTPCPWGAQTTGHAAAWPSTLNPIRTRHGYTTSADVYAPGTTTSGHKVTVHTGSARVYAGTPTGSHRLISTIATGATATLPALGTDEVFSIQSDDAFTYTLVAGTPPDPEPEPSGNRSSVLTTWSCTGSPCPWGGQTTGHAAAWPSTLNPIRTRHGYTTSADVYAPGTTTSGHKVTVHTGNASIYAGTPTGSHRLIDTIPTGGTVTLPAIAADEVFSVQSDDVFTYTLVAGTPIPPTAPPCQDPVTCDPVSWIPATWICNIPGCTDGDWVGGVISWPSWSAYDSNGRSGGNSRTVYAADGSRLHPYMGAWADGCEVTVVTGEILVIEWQRGTDTWRETLVGPGETHTIQLVGVENGAMLETPNNSVPFTARLDNCDPQPLSAG